VSTQQVSGIHAVASVLDKRPYDIVEILFQDNYQKNQRLTAIYQQANKAGLRVQILARKEMDKRSQNARHQGVIALCKSREKRGQSELEALLANLKEPALILVLDAIQDPHNLGACLRTADAAGVHAVVVPTDKAASITPTVEKVACGATETVPFFEVTNLSRALEAIKQLGVWIVGTDVDTSQTIYDMDYKGPTAIVIGAEGKGMRQLVKSHCDFLASIPMYGQVQSLNASVAAGICLYEAMRQRGASK